MTGIFLLTLVGYESSNNYTIRLLKENNSDLGKINGKKGNSPRMIRIILYQPWLDETAFFSIL